MVDCLAFIFVIGGHVPHPGGRGRNKSSDVAAFPTDFPLRSCAVRNLGYV